MSKPTLDDLRKLAEAAKYWWPDFTCAGGACAFWEKAKDRVMCPRCAGAKRAAEDVATFVDKALAYIEHKTPINADWRIYAIQAAEDAETPESYFGAPGVVAAFADAVREFCT